MNLWYVGFLAAGRTGRTDEGRRDEMPTQHDYNVKPDELLPGDRFEHRNQKVTVIAVKTGPVNTTVMYETDEGKTHRTQRKNSQGLYVTRETLTDEEVAAEKLARQLDRERDFTTRLKRSVLEGLTTEERVKRNLQEMHAALQKHDNAAYAMRNVMPYYVKKEAVILMWGEFAAVLRECDPDVDVIALLVSWADKKERELLRRGPDDGWSGGPASNAPARIAWDAQREVLGESFGYVAEARYMMNERGKEFEDGTADRFRRWGHRGRSSLVSPCPECGARAGAPCEEKVES